MGGLPLLLCCLFLSLSLSLAAAATVHQEWEISYQFKSPDCVRKLAVTINGQKPGPTIRATQGNVVHYGMQCSAGLNGLIVVDARRGGPDAEPFAYDGEHDVLLNDWWHKSTYEQATGLASVPIGWVGEPQSLLTENVAIHWHGIRQIGTPWADGTEGVTQCPILPGDTFTYTFVVNHPGTYMYHAHYGMQRSAGLNGLIVVNARRGGPDAEPFAYDGEHEELLNDRWHKSTQAPGLASVPIGWVGEPQSLLINGRGRFVNCSAMAAGACDATLPECAVPVFAVVPGKTYRFRMASVTSLSALNFEIEELLNDWWHKSTYEQATGLASVPIGWVGEPQLLLINGRGRFVNCSAMAGGACNATLPECAVPVFGVVPGPGKTYRFRIASVTSLSALNFEIEDRNRNARLIGYPAPAVTSDTTSSRGSRSRIGYALVVVTTLLATLYSATGRPVADQNPETAGAAIQMSARAPSLSGSLPGGGGRAPPPSTSSGDPAAGTGTGSFGTGGDEVQLAAILLVFLGFGTAIMVAILNIGFERILGGWSRGPKVAYKVSTWLATVFLALAAAFIAAWYRASPTTTSRRLLSISVVFAKLGVILFFDLLVVIAPCNLGRGACVAAMPTVAVISFLIATVGIWSRINFGILGPRRRRERPDLEKAYTGDDMVK